MKRICIIGHNLGFGGVQRNIAALANHFSVHYLISIVLMDNRGNIHYIDDSVTIIHLPVKVIDGLEHIKKNSDELIGIGLEILTFRIEELNKLFLTNAFDIAIAMEDYCAIALLKSHFKGKKIVSSRALPSAYYTGKLVHLLNRKFYYEAFSTLFSEADQVVVVDKAIGDELSNFGIESTVIENGIEKDKIKALSYEKIDIEKPFILCVGRIEFEQKGQNDLLAAFVTIKDQIEHNLILIGDGNDRQKLQNMVVEYDLEDRVLIVGFDPNPYKYMSRAQLFVFPSYYEGQPNVLLEAMSLGVACISYDFLPSWQSITDNGRCVRVVRRGNIDELSHGILYLLLNDDELKNIRENATRKAASLDMKNNFSKWSALLNE